MIIVDTATRNQIASPYEGLLIYNKTNDLIEWYDGTSWVAPNVGAQATTFQNIYDLSNPAAITTSVANGAITVTGNESGSTALEINANIGGGSNGIVINNSGGNALNTSNCAAVIGGSIPAGGVVSNATAQGVIPYVHNITLNANQVSAGIFRISRDTNNSTSLRTFNQIPSSAGPTQFGSSVDYFLGWRNQTNTNTLSQYIRGSIFEITPDTGSEWIFANTVGGVNYQSFRIRGRNIGIGTSSFGTSSEGVLGIANAPTVPTGNPTDGSVLYSNGGRLKTYYSGEKDIVVTDGVLTENSIPFIDSTGSFTEDNANLRWDNTNKRISITDDTHLGGGAGNGRLWFAENAPDNSNYTLNKSRSLLFVNSQDSITFRINNINNHIIRPDGFIFSTSGSSLGSSFEITKMYSGSGTPNMSLLNRQNGALSPLTDGFYFYSADYNGAGTAAPFFLTEDDISFSPVSQTTQITAGSTIDFTTNKVFGTTGTAGSQTISELTGALTVSTTNAVVGAVVWVYHRSSSDPLSGTQYKKNGSYNADNVAVNRIILTYFSTNIIEVTYSEVV